MVTHPPTLPHVHSLIYSRVGATLYEKDAVGVNPFRYLERKDESKCANLRLLEIKVRGATNQLVSLLIRVLTHRLTLQGK